MMDKVVVIGAGESGVGAAILAKKEGYKVFVSDSGKVQKKHRKSLKDNAITWEERQHSYEMMADADLVIKSPGISNAAPVIQELKSKGAMVISEIEFAARFTNATIIGITGSNGKTTTSMMTYQILKTAGKRVALAGNIGESFARKVAMGGYEYYVLEISSFQLDDIYEFSPMVAIITNVTEDHLDRYDYSFEKYLQAKLRINKNQKRGEFLIFNVDDYNLRLAVDALTTKAKLVPVSYENKVSGGVYYEDQSIVIDADKKNNERINVADVPFTGKHNTYNSMFASAVANILDITKEDIRESFRTFKGAPHRLEKVLTIAKTEYINDSKATNVNATYYALDSISTPILWIVGGIDKGNDYTALLPLVRTKVKGIVCLGKDTKKIVSFFSPVSDIICTTESMEEAVKVCYEKADYYDTVLLSPCCASFDLFEDYQDRGRQFKTAVRRL